MSTEENKVEAGGNTPAEASNQQQSTSPKSRPHVDIKKRVGELLGQSGTRVQEAVVTTLVDTQIERRTSAILKAVEKLETADKELRKLQQSGTVIFTQTEGENFNATAPSFTKEQTESIKKKREEIGKLEGALTKALGDTPDFQKLFELVGENKG